ncbi:MAG: hypothetical protein MZU97_22610 [Bacillus subtilis]|nr:hypothetical protein [Bacillus subtilis]
MSFWITVRHGEEEIDAFRRWRNTRSRFALKQQDERFLAGERFDEQRDRQIQDFHHRVIDRDRLWRHPDRTCTAAIRIGHPLG